MTNRIPVSLAYILIYNPNLPPPTNTSRADEDAREEEHVLFYTSRERAVSRDRMLRQVGLAKALVNFSDIFALGEGCDNVHSQARRMIHVSPEVDFWMHACIDLAYTPKPNRDEAKVTKGNDLPPQACRYHEDSVHDLALRGHLLRGYEAFKLLHGTFTSILDSRGPEGLRAQLEHFFTPWAWQWDLESPVEFGTHLGLPLHPSNSELAPIVVSFFKTVPSNAIPLLVSPPYIIEPKKTLSQYPPSLPVHLLSLVSPLGRPVPRRIPSKARSLKKLRTIHTNSTSSPFGFLSTAGTGMADAMNVKKWSWPGTLMFNKHKPLQRDLETTESETITKADTELIRTPIEGVDLVTFDTTISNQNLVQPLDGMVHNVNRNDQEVEVEAKRVDDAYLMMEHQRLDIVRSMSPTYMTPLLHPPSENGPSFSVFKVFISEPSEPLVVQQRSVLYLSMFQLVFALLMDVDWSEDVADQSLQAIQQNTSVFLQDIRHTIDSGSRPGSSAADEKIIVHNQTGYITSSSHSTVSFSEGYSTTNSQFFEGQAMLARDSSTIEVFSRIAPSQHWFVIRRGLGFDKAGERVGGEAYLEANDKDASLVDVDNELVNAVRRWVR